MNFGTNRWIAGLSLLVWLCIQLLGQNTVQVDLAIVTNPGTPVDEVSMNDLRQLLRGDRQYWKTDVPVILLIRAPVTRERTVVLKDVYEMSETQYKRFWIAKIFRAEAVSAPKTVYSAEMTNELVATLPGAIGFVEAKAVGQGVKVLRVDGHLPGDPGYPLH